MPRQPGTLVSDGRRILPSPRRGPYRSTLGIASGAIAIVVLLSITPLAGAAPTVVVFHAPYSTFADYQWNATSNGTCTNETMSVPPVWNATAGTLLGRIKSLSSNCAPNTANSGYTDLFMILQSNITFPTNASRELQVSWRLPVAYQALIRPSSGCQLNYSVSNSECEVWSNVSLTFQTSLYDKTSTSWGTAGIANGPVAQVGGAMDRMNYSARGCHHHNCTIYSSNTTTGVPTRFQGTVTLHSNVRLHGRTAIVSGDHYLIQLIVDIQVETGALTLAATSTGSPAALGTMNIGPRGMMLKSVSVT